jgi:hypothetical protein
VLELPGGQLLLIYGLTSPLDSASKIINMLPAADFEKITFVFSSLDPFLNDF